LEISGCLDSTACNYNSFVSNSDNSCTYPGCIIPSACNYNILAGCDDGTCIQPNSCGQCNGIEGCSDNAACNYADGVTCDNGTCIYPGCTDEIACNYDVNAGCDDNSCVVIDVFDIVGEIVADYDTFYYQYPGNPDHLFEWTIDGGNILSGQGDNLVEIIWLTNGTLCVTEIAEECNGDTVCIDVILSGVSDRLDKNFKIYPNPSSGEFTIQSDATYPSKYRLIDITAKTVGAGIIYSGLQSFDYQHLQAGSYTLLIESIPYRIIIE
jgi:hypothetical protein